jgi:hypothetical protein
MVNLYLDGCSFTYGVGLETSDTLAYLFEQAGYNVLNFSRPGKSNIAIAHDTYNNCNNADVFVLGFTFSHRFHIKYGDYNIDILPSNVSWPTKIEKTQGVEIENILDSLHKNFYLLHDTEHWGTVSDMLIDNTIDSLKLKNKKVFTFSWELRKTHNKILNPAISNRLPDGHLDRVGTKKLFDIIQNNLGSNP